METEHAKKINDQFSIRIKTYNHAANWMLDQGLLDSHIKMMGPGNQKKGLELCCGTGIVGAALKKHQWQMTGLDLTKEMVEVARDFFPAVVGDIEAMPFETSTFDSAVLRQAYMLLNGPAALKEIHRVLKPGGEFILCQSVPFSEQDDAQYEKVQWARHINMKTYYTTKDLTDEMTANGFEIVDTSFLSLEESIDKWVNSAPELSPELRKTIYNLIADAPESYKKTRNVHTRNGELFENWNWVLIKGRAIK